MYKEMKYTSKTDELYSFMNTMIDVEWHCTIIAQRDSDDLDFGKFKMALITYEENERARESHCTKDNDLVSTVRNKLNIDNNSRIHS